MGHPESSPYAERNSQQPSHSLAHFIAVIFSLPLLFLMSLLFKMLKQLYVSEGCHDCLKAFLAICTYVCRHKQNFCFGHQRIKIVSEHICTDDRGLQITCGKLSGRHFKGRCFCCHQCTFQSASFKSFPYLCGHLKSNTSTVFCHKQPTRYILTCGYTELFPLPPSSGLCSLNVDLSLQKLCVAKPISHSSSRYTFHHNFQQFISKAIERKNQSF